MRKVLIAGLLTLVPVTVAAQVPLVRVVGQRALSATTSTVSLTTDGDVVCYNVDSSIPSAVLTITGTWTGTISPRVRNAAGTLVTPATGDVSATSTTSNAAIAISNRGFTAVCLSATAAMTGTAVVSAVAGGTGAGGGSIGSVTQGTDPWIVAGAGTAGSAATGVVTIQGIASGTVVPVAPASGSFASDTTADSAASTTGPQIMGLGKNSTLPTPVTTGDAVRLLADLYGRLTPKNVCQDPDLVQSVVISTATAANNELVAISGSTVVTVCGFNVISTGTLAVQFIVGTGTACATNELNKTGLYPLVANGGINSGFGAPVFKGAAGDAVCIELSTTVQVDGILTYVQQ